MGFMNSESEFKRFPLHRTQQEEKWLEEKAREGLHFKRVDDGYYIFERSFGRSAYYKIDIAAEEDHLRFRQSEFAQVEQKMGWEIVSAEGDKIYWRNVSPAAVKRYFTTQRYIKKEMASARSFGIFIAILAFVYIFLMLGDSFTGRSYDTTIIVAAIGAAAIVGMILYQSRKYLLRYFEVARLKHISKKSTRKPCEASLPEPAVERKYEHFPIWKVKEEEKWLEKLAAEGSVLAAIADDTYSFARTAPASMQYKVVIPSREMTDDISCLRAYKAAEEQAGWGLLFEAEDRLYWKNDKGVRLEKKYPDIRKDTNLAMQKKTIGLILWGAVTAAILAAGILPLFMNVHIGWLAINPYSSILRGGCFLFATAIVFFNFYVAAIRFAGHAKLKRMAYGRQKT